MTQRRSPEHRPRPPWWLAGGTEECPHCGARHHLEVQRRCAACDAPSCADCLVGPDGLCPDCAAQEKAK